MVRVARQNVRDCCSHAQDCAYEPDGDHGRGVGGARACVLGACGLCDDYCVDGGCHSADYGAYYDDCAHDVAACAVSAHGNAPCHDHSHRCGQVRRHI